jgi:hypothetical protein
VINLGLTLGGSDAARFRLQVGASSISLVAGAIPEPATVVSLLGGLAVGACARRRRRSHFSWGATTLSNTQRFFFGLGGALSLLFASSVIAQPPGMLEQTRRDDFGGATPHASQFDYTTGNVPAGGIWTGIHNPNNGGDTATPALFVADGTDFFGADKSGKLFIEDLNTHVQTPGNGMSGIGWEGARNNGPLLFTEMPAEKDFEAVVKIDAQTKGNWSYVPIVARLKGPPVGRNAGEGLDPMENFVTMGSFKTAAQDGILTQNIVNAVEAEPPIQAAAGMGNLPLWTRVTKIGGQFTAASSADGTTWTNHQVVNNGNLTTTGQTLQVGLGYVNFGGQSGSADIDFFELKIYSAGTPTDARWNYVGSENWNNAANWMVNIPGIVPDQNTISDRGPLHHRERCEPHDQIADVRQREQVRDWRVGPNHTRGRFWVAVDQRNAWVARDPSRLGTLQ